MKKILGILTIAFTFSGCIPEDVLDQPTVAFYPTLSLSIGEGATSINTIILEASQKVVGEGSVVIAVSNSENLETVPPIVDGKLTVTFKDTNKASFTVVAKDEKVKNDYVSSFRLSSVSGGLRSVDGKQFQLKVIDNDNAIDQPFTEDFSSYPDKKDFAKSGWQNIAQAGGRKWQTRHFRDTKYIQFSAFRASDASNIAWLVLPRINVSALEKKTISFKNAVSFADNAKLELVYSNDYLGFGDITKATWQTLDFTVGTANNVWVESGVVDLSAITSVGFVAFRYTGAGRDTNNDGTFRLDDIKVGIDKASSGGGGSTPAVSIADARAKDGENVKVKGIVTTPDFGFRNDQYFIQDNTAGINVYFATDQGVASGDEVEIVGKISKRFKQVRIEVASVNKISSSNALPAVANITAAGLTVDNALQGSRVKLTGVTLVDASQWPTSNIATGSGKSVNAKVGSTNFTIRIDRGPESHYDGSPAPTGTFTITGILTRFNDDVQIMPFVAGDIN